MNDETIERSVFAPVLDAIDGIAYLVNARGALVDWNRPTWDAFARANDAPQLAGQHDFNIFKACAGEETANSYRIIMNRILTTDMGAQTFVFRCDSADVKREMRMTISRVRLPDTSPHLLFHALTISETVRPPIDLFDAATRKAILGEESGKPLVRICSYCLKIFDVSSKSWIDAEAYYKAGGCSDVRLSHGVCNICYDTIVSPAEAA